MTLQIRKAERRRAKLRIGMSGPSGSGKTYSALLLARGMATAWEMVLISDSENGSGELYSDLGPYNVISLTAPFNPEKYIEAIEDRKSVV
jgi:adenylylsulfate kinase-like enzyme